MRREEASRGLPALTLLRARCDAPRPHHPPRGTGQDLITPGDSPQSCQHGPPRHHVERTDTVDGEHSCVRVGFRQRLQNVGHAFRSCSSPQCVLEWSSETFHNRHDLLGDSPTDQTSHDITRNDAPHPVFGPLSSSPCGLLRLPLLALLPGPIVPLL